MTIRGVLEEATCGTGHALCAASTEWQHKLRMAARAAQPARTAAVCTRMEAPALVQGLAALWRVQVQGSFAAAGRWAAWCSGCAAGVQRQLSDTSHVSRIVGLCVRRKGGKQRSASTLTSQSSPQACLRLTERQDGALPRLLQTHNTVTASRARLVPMDPPPELVHATSLSGAPDRQHLWVAGVPQVLQVQAGLGT